MRSGKEGCSAAAAAAVRGAWHRQRGRCGPRQERARSSREIGVERRGEAANSSTQRFARHQSVTASCTARGGGGDRSSTATLQARHDGARRGDERRVVKCSTAQDARRRVEEGSAKLGVKRKAWTGTLLKVWSGVKCKAWSQDPSMEWSEAHGMKWTRQGDVWARRDGSWLLGWMATSTERKAWQDGLPRSCDAEL